MSDRLSPPRVVTGPAYPSSDPESRRFSRHESVFAKLVAIMATMAASLLLLVGGFFWFILHGVRDDILLGPDGASYPFTMNPAAMQGVHVAFLVLLLMVMTGIVRTAHAVLKRQLRPLRDLSEGVTRLGAGELDVVLPNRTRDEFGRLTDGFNRMVSQVRDMIAARDQLLLDVSHELRSPLTRMKVALELLPDSERRAGMAADVAEMEQLIAEILELERLRDRRGVNLVRQDLMPIVREVAERFEQRLPGVRLVSCSREIPVDIDAAMVRTVFRNLLANASKYSLAQSQPIEVSAEQHDDTAVVRVTDHGPGIPESDRERVFELFFRVDRSRSKDTGGYGLGLSICKRVMEAHGGSIGIESSAGQGASFVLRFPNGDGERGNQQPSNVEPGSISP